MAATPEAVAGRAGLAWPGLWTSVLPQLHQRQFEVAGAVGLIRENRRQAAARGKVRGAYSGEKSAVEPGALFSTSTATLRA